MKNKLKFIIPIVIAVIAIIIAVLCIDFTSAEKTDVSSLVSTAQKYLIENNYEQAIAEFNKIIEIDPMNVDAYLGIAEAYLGVGNTEKAVEWLEKGYTLTGDERLRNLIDELSFENPIEETIVSEIETEASSSETTIEEAKPTEVQITYSDNWYSIFNYDNDGNILSMSLYNKNGEKRLFANYAYMDNNIKRTVYVDDNLYETTNVAFTDIMANIEKQKKERANTTEEHDNNWWVYDENGDCIEHGWHNLDSYRNPTDDSGEESFYKNGKIYKSHSYTSSLGWNHITYYDENGYRLRTEGEGYDFTDNNVIYTYEYDEYGYPIVEYENGKKSNEYLNFYKNNKFGYAIWHFKNEYNNNHGLLVNNYDGFEENTELNENGQYVRYIYHNYLDYYNDLIPDNFYTYVNYYVPSFDETKIIDSIWIDCENFKPLFECPYCNE